MDCADCFENVLLLGFADDIYERYVFFNAKLVQHLPQIGGRSGVNDGAVAFPPHRYHHAQRGERVDEGGRTRSRRCAFWQC
jgi:hypothetical protein